MSFDANVRIPGFAFLRHGSPANDVALPRKVDLKGRKISHDNA